MSRAHSHCLSLRSVVALPCPVRLHCLRGFAPKRLAVWTWNHPAAGRSCVTTSPRKE